jgi:aminopeptidase N
MKILIAIVAAGLLVSSAPALSKPQSIVAGRIALPTNVRPERYDLTLAPDAANLSFHGTAQIQLTVLRPTKKIVLNAADLRFDKVSLSSLTETPRIVLDAHKQTATFAFTRTLAPGRHTLTIDYTGKIYQQASGLFALDYETADGVTKRALFTQFENSDARRFAPTWDEPGVKAIFALSIKAPADQMLVSNMPVASTQTLVDSQLTTFQDSPKMSAYLLFFAMGDFERINQKVGDTDVGVIVRRGETEKGRYGLDAAIKLLDYYNDYFGLPYPLPKLDLIAAPGQSQFFAAMENWGAILYFDYTLLIDPKLSTETDRMGTFITIAHEMAHQWFGNLVTMAWWDDLWLNEGFASWMEYKATDHFHPEWKIWLAAQTARWSAMRLDSRVGTHPIVTPIPDVFAAATAFDDITYQKGMAVIQMLEAYIGEEAFRDGVRNYLRRHAYENTVSNDLWMELDGAAPRKVSDIAHDFTLQAGVPLIQVTPTAGGLSLKQTRFGADASQRKARTWRTPVTMQALGGPTWKGLVSANTPAVTRVDPPAIVNAGQTGYFRTVYSPELWATLTPRFANLADADQLGLIFDSRALGEAGVTPMSDFLTLAEVAPINADPIVLTLLIRNLEAIDSLFEGRTTQPTYRRFVIDHLTPIARRTGWDPKPGETDNEALLRSAVLSALGNLGDPATTAEARRRFNRWLTNAGSLSGADRQTVLSIVAVNADTATWEAIHTKAIASKDTTERARLYGYLGASHDSTLAERALQLALSDEPMSTEIPSLIAAVAEVFPDKAYDFAIANRTSLDAAIEPSVRTRYFTRLAQLSRDAAMLTKLARFSRTVPKSSHGEINKAQAVIRVRRSLIAERVPQMEAWLAHTKGG